MKHLLSLLFLLILPDIAAAQLNIDSCQAKARMNYPLIKQYDLITKSAEYTISNANKAYLPQVSLTGIGAYVISGFPTISMPGAAANEPDKLQAIGIAQVNQVLWDGGATKTQKEIALANAEVEKSTLEVNLFSIRERVNQLFFGILLIDEQLALLEIHRDNLNRNLEKVQLSKDNGLAYQTDVDELKSEMLGLEQKRIEYTYTRKGYVAVLSFLTGQELSDDIQLEKPVVSENTSTLTNNRPELLMYANQRRLTEAAASMNKVSNMPKVGLLGAGVLIEPGMSFGNDKLNSLAIAGISLSWNTAGLYRNSNNKSLDKIRIDRIANQQETFLFSNNLQLTQTNSEIEKQKAIIRYDNEIIQMKSNIKKSYQLRYENGMCTMNDVLTAVNRENEAMSNQAYHNIQLLMSMYNYKTISGN